MSTEEQIEEILIRASSIGFKKELLKRVSCSMVHNPKQHYVNALVKEFQQMLNEITD